MKFGVSVEVLGLVLRWVQGLGFEFGVQVLGFVLRM